MSNPSQPPAGPWSEQDLIAAVEAGPKGAHIGAFFDFDGTLIDGYSLSAFARHHLRSLQVTPADLGRMLLTGIRGVTSEEDFEQFTVLSMHTWAGRSEDELAELGERLFVQGISGSLYPEAWRLVEAHQRAGHTVVLASSATRFQVEPTARAMGVSHILVSPVEIVNGICTGRPGGPLLWRAGKAAAVHAFAAEYGIDLPQSYAYSNGDEDVPFLRAAGRSRAINPGRHLAEAARHYGWPVARFRSRRAGAADIARTAAGLAGMLGGFTAGMVLGAATGSRREAVDLGTTLAGELGSALAGIRLDVHGAEHLAARPAVFLFNHQSQLDVLILAKLLRGGFTGVAKKELANSPGFGLMFRLADVAFVDRQDNAQARKALEPAVQKLRDGISLVIAPEGTRSATPALGPFKKGAFHVAMQAGVPIVPIVIRNSGELMWRGATTIHAGTVQIAVLPPVAAEGWDPAGLDEHIHEVRGQYLATLANWPAHGSGQVTATTTASSGPPPALPLDWGASPRMNPLETAMWRAESADPRLRVTVSLLELLDPAPDWDRLLAAHEWASRMVPRMRQRVLEPALALGTPAWVTAGDFDLSRHLHRVRLPGPGTLRQLLDVVQDFAAAPLDRDRPLWQALLVEGLADGRAGYVAKSHHSVTDGLGAVQLMMRLHSRTAEHDPDRPEPPVPVAGERVAHRAVRRAGRRRGPRHPHGGGAPGHQGARHADPAVGRGLAGSGAGAVRGPLRRPGRGRPVRFGAACPAGRRLALRLHRRATGRPQGRGESGGRIAQRRAAGRGDRRVPPLPRAARRPGGPAHRRLPDQPARPGRPAGREPVHRRQVRRAHGRDRPGGQDRRGAAVRAGRPRGQRRGGGYRAGRPGPGDRLAARPGRQYGLGPADQQERRPGLQHPRRAFPGVHRGLADHPHVPVRPAARLRRDDHPHLAQRGLLHRHQHRHARGHRPRQARR